jgi:hypothetical protein
MIPRLHCVDKLRQLGFAFKEQKPNVEVWKRSGDLQFATLRRRDLIAEAEFFHTLRQAGLTQSEIAAWHQGITPVPAPSQVPTTQPTKAP